MRGFVYSLDAFVATVILFVAITTITQFFTYTAVFLYPDLQLKLLAIDALKAALHSKLDISSPTMCYLAFSSVIPKKYGFNFTKNGITICHRGSEKNARITVQTASYLDISIPNLPENPYVYKSCHGAVYRCHIAYENFQPKIRFDEYTLRVFI